MPSSFASYFSRQYGAPGPGFEVAGGTLRFHGIDVYALARQYGTPLRMLYLPAITDRIRRAESYFAAAFDRHAYRAHYRYAYCIKANPLIPVVERALAAGAHLETSSVFDVELILHLAAQGHIRRDRYIIHNGYKTPAYLARIMDLQRAGFTSSVIVLDNEEELTAVKSMMEKDCERPARLGLRMATHDATGRASRLGVPDTRIESLYEQIRTDSRLQLDMLHLFVDDGMQAIDHYLAELDRLLDVYGRLQPSAGPLQLNLGGGFPIRHRPDDAPDYAALTGRIVGRIAAYCQEAGLPVPDLMTEFGSYTVGEAGAVLLKVLGQKQMNATTWYMVDDSLINTLPDAWATKTEFILLPLNGWSRAHARVRIGGISCDQLDVYPPEGDVLLSAYQPDAPLYVGFFHTGAYQEALGGMGGITHCLVPAPAYVMVDEVDGTPVPRLFRPSQTANDTIVQLKMKN